MAYVIPVVNLLVATLQEAFNFEVITVFLIVHRGLHDYTLICRIFTLLKYRSQYSYYPNSQIVTRCSDCLNWQIAVVKALVVAYLAICNRWITDPRYKSAAVFSWKFLQCKHVLLMQKRDRWRKTEAIQSIKFLIVIYSLISLYFLMLKGRNPMA